MRAQILIQPETAARGSRMLEALRDTAPMPVSVRDTYSPKFELMVTYGTGHPVRRPWWLQHRNQGGRCIGLDLGYWDRAGTDAAMRFTLDTDHPPQFIREEPPERWDRRGESIREDAGAGPVLLIGQGMKAVQVRREPVLGWERRRLAALKAAGHRVVYRPKRHGDPIPKGVDGISREETIEQALQGKSLVVCRHSNVGVDACIAGVPVVCEGGAAAALYGSDICTTSAVTPSQRLSFLRSLAWWNWSPSEAAQAWAYMLERVQCG